MSALQMTKMGRVNIDGAEIDCVVLQGSRDAIREAGEHLGDNVKIVSPSLFEALFKAILLLDCAMPYFEREAAKEKRRNETEGGLREITCQERLKAVTKMVHEVGPTVGYVE